MQQKPPEKTKISQTVPNTEPCGTQYDKVLKFENQF